jgi:hypothetical protein
MGVVCPMEGAEVYGYVTASNIKILAMIHQDSIIPLNKTREPDIKLLFVRVCLACASLCQCIRAFLSSISFLSH